MSVKNRPACKFYKMRPCGFPRFAQMNFLCWTAFFTLSIHIKSLMSSQNFKGSVK